MKLHIVEDGKLVPYTRIGECKQCGKCCRKKITFRYTIQKAGKQDTDETPIDWHNWEGFSTIYARGIYWYILVDSVENPEPDDEHNPCCSLEGNLCDIHGDQFKIPMLCPLWPVNEKGLLPNCGYSFKKGLYDSEAV